MNQAGIDLLKSFEGWSGVAYPDPATGGEPFTIGYGFTKGVSPGDTMTLEEGEARLEEEVEHDYERPLRDLVMAPYNENQWAAMVVLSFNIGVGAFRTSSVLRNHNAGNKQAAADSFLLWNRGGGKVMKGLVRRREAERALYLTQP